MTTIAAFLMAITGSLTARVLTSLGIGFISYTALTSLASAIISGVSGAYNSAGGNVLAILNLLGVGQAFGIILGAMVTRASMSAIKRLGVVT